MDICKNFLASYYQRHNQRRQEHLATLNLPIAGKTVLEIGAGIGDHTSFFTDRHCSVTSAEGRQELLDIFQQRFPQIPSFLWDIESLPPEGITKSQIVYAYGILYHTKKPAIVLENLASLCTEFLLLETCVSFGEEESINLVIENINDPTQAINGVGCRPTRSWIFRTLKQFFPFVYLTKTQPWHEEFPIDWNQPSEKNNEGKLNRSVFVAAKIKLCNENLSLDLIDKQEHR
jgi:hypothetical protein